jgi:ATP-dependent Clp protease ATP-binding subunit ClpC
MFERFTDRARNTVVHAQEEARLLRHDYIGTEHLLLALVREREGVAAEALRGMGISPSGVRQQVTELIGTGDEEPSGHIPFTPRAKKTLELALREALQLRHNYIGTEHILLGIVREGEGVAATVLVNLGAELKRVRRQVTRVLERHGAAGTPPAPPSRTPAAEQVVAAASQLAGGGPMGSHHLLEALVRAEDSAAAKVLAAVGLDADTLAAKIDEVGIEGTADLTDEEAAARQMEITLSEREVHIVLRDETAVELARAVTEQLGGPVRGDDPVAGGLVGLHQAALQCLSDLRTRVAPPPDPEPGSGSGVSALIHRAVHSRLRRRTPRPGSSPSA